MAIFADADIDARTVAGEHLDDVARDWGPVPEEAADARAVQAATGSHLDELEQFLREADLHLEPSVNAPRWDGTPMDLVDSVGWLFVADQTRA